MAIDSSMFAAKIPAATYAVGDTIPMKCIRGPAIVRDGFGRALLKRVFTIADTGTAIFKVELKNSNWVDSLSNPALTITETSLDNNSGAIQSGHDAVLTPNSGWEVKAVCIVGGTESADADVIALIDIDYPSVAAVQDPKSSPGNPVTVDLNLAHTVTAKGSVETATWDTVNVDFLKAGYKYLLAESSFKGVNVAPNIGFISISGAAAQRGLERIIPARATSIAGLRYNLDYSTPLVKGPMNINIMSLGTAASGTVYAYFDFVKRNI